MKNINTNMQSGFTLVEIAIVLVIVGLLLGGVLKGTELIENSKVKRAANEINGVAAAYNSYVDRYSRVPGDDTQASVTARGAAWSGLLGGNNNGVLAGNLNQTFNAANGEGTAFWQHLKAAGFIKGNPSDTGVSAMPRNAFGGVIGVTHQTVNGLTGLKVCLSQVPGKSAVALDNQLDDGRGETGNVRATEGVAAQNTAPLATPLTTPYTEDNEYTVCVRL
jgi:prepilin-type N-terminal cleavage/methylation domain-containing protein